MAVVSSSKRHEKCLLVRTSLDDVTWKQDNASVEHSVCTTVAGDNRRRSMPILRLREVNRVNQNWCFERKRQHRCDLGSSVYFTTAETFPQQVRSRRTRSV